MAKIVERNNNPYVLKPLKQYLENNGVRCELKYEWTGIKGSHGDSVIIVEDDQYEKAMEILSNIDRYDTDDGIDLRNKYGKTSEEMNEVYKNIGKIAARLLILFLLIVLVYNLFFY